MAFGSSQTVKILVSLDASSAKRELTRVHDQARQASARKANAPGSPLRGRGRGLPGRPARVGLTGRGSGRLFGKLARTGLGKFAAQVLGVRRGGIVGEALQGVGARLAGRAIGGLAVGASVAVIGTAVKLYIEHQYPQLIELARNKVGLDKLMAILSGAGRAAQDFQRMSESFSLIGKDMPGGSNAFADKLRKLAVGDAALDLEKEKAKRQAMSELMKDKGFDEFVRRKILGTTFGQGAASAPDLRAWFLEQFGMR